MACEAYGRWYPPIPVEMEHFAALVAAHIRNECAKLCEGESDALASAEWNKACAACVAAIRSLGKPSAA